MTGVQYPAIDLVDQAATQQLGVRLGHRLYPGSILLLEGELGSGKTTFVQGLGQGLGIVDIIASPTFTLVNEYDQGRLPLYHLDLYRLSAQQVDDLYLETYWQGVEMPLGIVAIEWPDRLSHRPHDYLQLRFSYQGAGRRLEWSAGGDFDWRHLLLLGLEQG